MLKARTPCTSISSGEEALPHAASAVLLALGQQLIQLLLGLTTASVGSLHGCNGFGSALEMFLLQTSDHPFGLFVDKFEC